MENQVDSLTKIEHGRFTIIDQRFYGSGWSSVPASTGKVSSTQAHDSRYHRQHERNHRECVYHGPQISTIKVPVQSSNETAHRFVRSSVLAEKPTAMNCEDVAKLYGGMVITDYRRKKA